MIHAERSPILLAGFLIAAALPLAAAQSGALHSPPSQMSARGAQPRTSVNAEVRLPTSDASPPTKHKTFRDQVKGRESAKSNGDEKGTAKTTEVFAPWTVIGALAFVVALILLLSRFFRKHAPLFQQTLPAEALEILGRRFVDQRQTILLVRIGSRILVVGSSTNGLQPLGELSDPVEVDLIAGLCRRDASQRGLGSSFLRLLQGQTGSTSLSPVGEAHMTVRNPSASSPPTAVTYASRVGPPSQEPSSTGQAQPEHDLRRRLRGTPITRHEDYSGGIRG